jgi:hypothetical protein
MRILEVTLCTLLAVIATTPLRSEFEVGARSLSIFHEVDVSDKKFSDKRFSDILFSD